MSGRLIARDRAEAFIPACSAALPTCMPFVAIRVTALRSAARILGGCGFPPWGAAPLSVDVVMCVGLLMGAVLGGFAVCLNARRHGLRGIVRFLHDCLFTSGANLD